MTNNLVVITNSLKVPKIKKILLYEMKFVLPNYSCLQNHWLGGYRPQIPVLSVLCPQLNFLNLPPPSKIPGYATGWPYRTSCTAHAFRNFFDCVKYSNLKFQIRFSVWKCYVYVDKNHLDWAFLTCLQCYCCETRRSANICLKNACWRALT